MRFKSQMGSTNSNAIQRSLQTGRAGLAQSEGDGLNTEAAALLISLLWHEEEGVRTEAANALAGGDGQTSYQPLYGHFAPELLRGLQSETPPEDEMEEAVFCSLRRLLERCTANIAGMANMRASFLSSGLYLSLLVTCRDTVMAVHRLRVYSAHPELCHLLLCLSRPDVKRKLNPLDRESLSRIAVSALASLPTDRIPFFWNSLDCAPLAEKRTLLPVLQSMQSTEATPFLLNILPEQPAIVVSSILSCLERVADEQALPALELLLRDRNRTLRNQAKSVLTAIKRRKADSPERTLLRSALGNGETQNLLRPISVIYDAPQELLRVAGKNEEV